MEKYVVRPGTTNNGTRTHKHKHITCGMPRNRFTKNLCAAENDNDDENVWAKWESIIIYDSHIHLYNDDGLGL